MPELPEVETVRRLIEPHLVGKLISKVEFGEPCAVFLTRPQQMARALQGATIEGVERLGKYLIINCGRDGELVLHFGMTGSLTIGVPTLPDRHIHMVMYFDSDPTPVYYRDPRTFGRIELIPANSRDRCERLAKLGPDALTVDATKLHSELKRRSVAVKAVLMDQTVYAGIGNIYADECLFLAGIKPARMAARVSATEAARLAVAIPAVLKRAIDAGGSSISDYVHPDGSEGSYQKQHAVYGRQGQACRDCGKIILHGMVAQRSTHYCPGCQR